MSCVLIITGAHGVGKTTVSGVLTHQLPGTVAHMGGDTFGLAVTPWNATPALRAFTLANLASFAEHAIHNRYDWIVLEWVLLQDDYIKELTQRIGEHNGCTHIVSLTASRDVQRRRLRSKPCNRDKADDDLIPCFEWADQVERLTLPTRIETTDLTIDETVARIRSVLHVAPVAAPGSGDRSEH